VWGTLGAWNRDVPRGRGRRSLTAKIWTGKIRAKRARELKGLAEGGEEAGYRKSGCGCVGAVRGMGAWVSVGDHPDAAEGMEEEAKGREGVTASAGAVCAYQDVGTTNWGGGGRVANKILFGTQMCTYNLWRGNKRKRLRVSGGSKPGLTRHDIWIAGGWFPQPFGCPLGFARGFGKTGKALAKSTGMSQARLQLSLRV